MGSVPVTTAALVALICLSASVSSLNLDNIRRIVESATSLYGSDGQYAMALDLPQGLCDRPPRDDISLQNALGDNKEQVRSALQSGQRMYEGNRLIIALPRSNAHSEARLLNPSGGTGPSALQKLFQRNGGGDGTHCLIFFTYYSPCLRTCLNVNNRYNILNKLNQFTAWDNNYKALVFRRIFDNQFNSEQEQREALHSGFQRIQHIDVYRCDSGRIQCSNCRASSPSNNPCLSYNLPPLQTSSG